MRCFALVAAIFAIQSLPLAAQETEEPVAAPEPMPEPKLEDLLEYLPKILPDPVNKNSFDTSRPVVGIGFQKTSEGMRIARVLPGSSAQDAGLLEGMIVQQINRIKVDNFALTEIGKILGAIDGEMEFLIDDGKVISLTKAPIRPASDKQE